MQRNASCKLKLLLLPLLLIAMSPLLAGAQCNLESAPDHLFNAIEQDIGDDNDRVPHLSAAGCHT